LNEIRIEVNITLSLNIERYDYIHYLSK